MPADDQCPESAWACQTTTNWKGSNPRVIEVKSVSTTPPELLLSEKKGIYFKISSEDISVEVRIVCVEKTNVAFFN